MKLNRRVLIRRFVVYFSFCFYAHGALAISEAEQQHLLGRISFGGKAHTELALEKKSRQESVAAVLDTIDPTITVAPPGWLAYTLGNVSDDLPLTSEALRKFKNNRNKQVREQREQLKGWWLKQIHQGESPVAERLLLFWQNFFTTQIDMLPNPKLGWQQQLVMRRHLLGNFRHMLRDMNEDPALLWYLDNHLNNKKKANENYARELLELYTLGEGHYSESDVKELARAMTGAGVDRKTWLYEFHESRHDSGEKSVLGAFGNLKPNEVIDIILRQPRSAEYLVERLWRAFVSPTVDKESVRKLAADFRKRDFELRPLIEDLFNHPAFWDERNRLVLVKSPVELLVQAHLESDKPIKNYEKTVKDLAEMGQDLFNPPDVGGWPQGDEWINSVRLAKRHKYLLSVAKSSVEKRQLNYQLK